MKYITLALGSSVIALLVALNAGVARLPAHPPRTSGPPTSFARTCEGDLPCCRAALAGFCRVGCSAAMPRLLRRVPPDLAAVKRPYPSGVTILEVGISESGQVVSACVLRGVREDFDKAAQFAARRWRWTPPRLFGKPVGVALTVTVPTPDWTYAGR